MMFMVSVSIVVTLVNAKTQVYYDLPSDLFPASPSTHPRIYIRDDITRLTQQWNDHASVETQIFKHEIDKLMSYSSACGDWRCDSGWPVAALALASLLSGDPKYGQKACDVYLPYFNGVAAGNFETDVWFAVGYDWLFHHSCFTAAKKLDLRTKLISWSDSSVVLDEAGSWTPHDSDRNMAVADGHFIAGLAIVGEDPTKGSLLLKRGWTAWKYGLNTHSTLPDFPVSKFFTTTLKSGIPLPGWDYGMMSDLSKGQVLWYVMDELGVFNSTEFSPLKQWWVRSLESLMHHIDPGNTHYRWIGDQQNPNNLDAGYGFYIFSYLANCIYLSERYGYSKEAARGRYFIDQLTRSPWGISEGDPMLLFTRALGAGSSRLNPATSNMSRYSISMGQDESMGIANFRSHWNSSLSPTSPTQVTWGGFYGIGAYIVDHMFNSAGSFWIWRNGDYLLTEPRNYGGNEKGSLWNSLSIPNPAVPNNNENHDDQGPVVYFNEGPAYLERGRYETNPSLFGDLMYVMMNGDQNYNVPPNQWAACTGPCRQPVGNYTRHFLYDGGDFAILADRALMAWRTASAVRFRTNGKKAPTVLSSSLVSIPSEKGFYRTLAKVLTPTGVKWKIYKEAKTLFRNVPNWQVDKTMLGFQIKGSFVISNQHRVVTVLNFAKKGTSNELNSAAAIQSQASFGGCAGSICLIIGINNVELRTSVIYTTPVILAFSRHVVADMDPSVCYKVVGSKDGPLAAGVMAKDDDNSVIFISKSSGAQTFVISQDIGCVP
jgi:hypothetical protein